VAAMLTLYPDDVPGFGKTPNARNGLLGRRRLPLFIGSRCESSFLE